MSRPVRCTCFHSDCPNTPPSPPASGGRMGSALKSPLGGKEQSCAFVLARSVSSTPRVLSLPPPSSDTGSQSARYVPAARERCESRAEPGQVPCGVACRPLCSTGLRRGWSSLPPLPWDAAASESPAEAAAAICGAEGATRSRPRELSSDRPC